MDRASNKKTLEIPKMEVDETIIKISGHFNQKNMEDLERAFSTVDQISPRFLVVDCRDLLHLDTPNVALLVGKHNEFKAKGRRMVLRGVPPSIQRILRFSRLDTLLEIEEEPEEASASEEPQPPRFPDPEGLESADSEAGEQFSYRDVYRNIHAAYEALANDHRELRKRLQATRHDLSFLEKRTRIFNRLLDRDPLCQSILEGAMEVVSGADAGLVLLFNSNLNTLEAHSMLGFPRGRGLAQLVLRQGETLPGIQAERFWGRFAAASGGVVSGETRQLWEEALQAKPVRAALVHPLVSQQAQVGFLVLVSVEKADALEKHDEDLLDSLTLAGATALEKSFLVERIRCSEIHLRSIIESIPLSVFSVDENGHVDTWNREAENLFGWSAGDAIGKRITHFYPSDASREAGMLNRAIEYLTPWTGEIEIQTQSGEIVPTRHIVQPFLNAEGIKQGMVVVVEDIRKMVELRDQMMKAQKLESVGILAGGIAHDFNNLIGAILGYSSFLIAQLGEENKNIRYAEVIESTAEQASQLTRKLLEFAGGTSDQKVLIDLCRLMEDCLELVKPSLKGGIRLDAALPSRPLFAHVSPTSLQQVVLNLCLNARDVLPEGGSIFVRLMEGAEQPVSPSASADSDGVNAWAVIEVEDDGPGIPESARTEIFKPFFTTKGPGKGSGLGLAMVQRTVLDHGGWIELETEIGRGTLFRIGLPLHETAAGAETQPRDEDRTGKQQKKKKRMVLIVDDEPLVRELATTVLESAGIETRSAADGSEALELFKKDPDSFVMAVVDVLMPVMGGEELVKEITALRPHFPILLSSGYAPRTSLDEKIKKGEIEFLPKPYRSRQLLEKVESILKSLDGAEGPA